MDIYIAARFSNQERCRSYRLDLQALGHTVTSRWLDRVEDERDAIADARNSGSDEHDQIMRLWAQEDLDDVLASQCVIYVAPGGRRGGCHVELGMGIALFLRCMVVGTPENVFHSLPLVERYEQWEDLIFKLKSEPGNGQVHQFTSVVTPQW